MRERTDRPRVTPIVVVCDGEPTSPQTNSGVALNFIQALSARSDVHVIASVSSRPPKAVTQLVRALAFHPNANRWRQRARRGGLARIARSLSRDARIRRLAPPPDCVIVHVRSFYSPTKLRYVSFIDTTVLDDDRNWAQWEDATPRNTSPRAFRLERRFYREAALVATASKAAQMSLLTDYELPPRKIAVIGGGTNALVDSSGAKPAEASYTVEGPTSARKTTIRVLFIGRDFLRKGGDILLNAMAILFDEGIDIELTIAGCKIDNLPSYASSLGFITDRTQIRGLFMASDIFCLPARWEPYGLVVQEAMSAALPVIVSDVGELPEIVLDEVSGLVVRSENHVELATALRRLATSPALRDQLGANALLRATTDLTWTRVADRFVTQLRAVLYDASGACVSPADAKTLTTHAGSDGRVARTDEARAQPFGTSLLEPPNTP